VQTGAVHRRTKFNHVILNSCWDRTFLFCVGLAENAYSGAFLRGLWGYDSLNGSDIEIGPTVQPVHVTKEQKRHGKKHNSGYLPRPPTLLQWHMDLRLWSHSESSYIFQVSSKSVPWFRSHGVSKIAFSNWLGQWFIQQLVLLYKPWLYKCQVYHNVTKPDNIQANSESVQRCLFQTLQMSAHAQQVH